MKRLFVTALVGLVLCLNGCYYGHLASGQLKLLWGRQPIERAIADETLPEQTRDLLQLVGSVRAFATELGLHVDGQYTSYVDWPSDRVVTTLVRTRPGSLDAVPYWFPVVGELPYKGYFDRQRADDEAERLRRDEGFDVCVSPITAYSTLGWLDDPVTTPMLGRGAASLVETLLHEFVHSTAFLPDAADFNESVAQFIGQQASILYFERVPRTARGALPGVARVRAGIEDRQTIDAVVADFRTRLLEIRTEADRAGLREDAERETREILASLPLEVLSPERVAATLRLSDACLALSGTYAIDLPRHARVLTALDGDLEAMIRRLELWADEGRTIEEFYLVD